MIVEIWTSVAVDAGSTIATTTAAATIIGGLSLSAVPSSPLLGGGRFVEISDSSAPRHDPTTRLTRT